MKWKPTLAIWVILFVPLTVYNIFGNPIFFPAQSTQFSDSKILNYNFSMATPVFVVGNFSIVIPLNKSPSNYVLSAHVNASADYESYGAYGTFRLWASVAENGFYHSPNNARMDFVLPSPVPPGGYGLATNGPLPQANSPETFTHLLEGDNTLSFNYTFFSAGMNSAAFNYGPGYFKLSIGPFVAKVTDLTVVYSLDAASELILAGLLFPIAHGIRIIIRKLRK